MTKRQFNTWQTEETIATVNKHAQEKGITQAAVVEMAVNELDSCHCGGKGIAFRHRGEWIYCACRAGLDAEMGHMANQLQVIAATMKRLGDDGREDTAAYDDLAFQFERIMAEYDDLEEKWNEVLT